MSKYLVCDPSGNILLSGQGELSAVIPNIAPEQHLLVLPNEAGDLSSISAIVDLSAMTLKPKPLPEWADSIDLVEIEK